MAWPCDSSSFTVIIRLPERSSAPRKTNTFPPALTTRSPHGKSSAAPGSESANSRTRVRTSPIGLTPQPVRELGARRRRRARLELRAQLTHRATALGEHVVVVDRLEVQLPREDEVAVVERGVAVERLLERDPHRVLDEARLEVRMLDDEQLVGPLEQLVHGRAHRRLDDVDQPFGVDGRVRSDEQRAAPALVVGGERDQLEDA